MLITEVDANIYRLNKKKKKKKKKTLIKELITKSLKLAPKRHKKTI